jgi:hypothetical protein
MKKRFILCGIVSVFFIMLSIVCALATTDGLSVLSAKDNHWNYSQEIIITENAGKILKDYPVPVRLNSSNFNFSKAKSDGSDIRFYSDNKTINYWIETWNSKNEEAVIWVKVPALPANGNSLILMKYGNAGVVAASNGKKTFDLFDGFDDSTSSELYWNTKSAGGGMVKFGNGICKVLAPVVHAYDSSAIYSKDSFDINSMFVVKRMKVTTGTDNRGPLLRQGFIDQIDSGTNEIRHETEFANESRVSWETVYRNQRYNPYDLTDVFVPERNWYVSEIAWFEENDTRKIAWFKNGVRELGMDYASNDFITNSPMHIYLYAASYPDSSKNTGYMEIDYVLVRKFVGIEPTVRIVSTQVKPDASVENTSGNISKNNSGNIYGSTSKNSSGSETVSASEVTPDSEVNNKVSAPEGVTQVQENMSENKTVNSNTIFPEYDVNISGIKLSSPYRFDFPVLVKEFDSSGINTIFLKVDSEDVWQYERFVKMARTQGISIHAVLLEDFNCSEKEALNTCQNSLNAVLDYNRKSLAPFDGIDIYIKPSTKEVSENNSIDYMTLFETAHQRAGENVSISASIPPHYSASNIDEIAPLVDFFIVRAYCGETGGLNSASSVIDAIALEMGEIRGAGSKGLIEVSVGEGFEDKVSIQKLFSALADYYSKDSAFLGVSTSDYDTYVCLPVKADPNQKKPLIPGLPRLTGFDAFSVFIACFGVFALLKVKRK